MTLLKTNHRGLSKPVLCRFIVALFLIKSKPTNLSVQGASNSNLKPQLTNIIIEFLSSLRSNIKEGCRLDDSTTFQAYVDTSAFWRDAYKKSEEAQIQLRAKIFELERIQDAREDQRNRTFAEAAQGERKIHKIEAENERPSKRTRATTDGPPVIAEKNSFESFADDIASSISGENRETIAQLEDE